MAIVSRFSRDKAKSVKKAAKQSLTQRIRQTVGISDDSSSSSSSSESEDSEDDTVSTGTKASKLKLRNSTVPDSPVDQDATLRGKPAPENDQDGDHSDGGDPEAGTSKRRFRLRRKKDGKRRHKTRREKAKQDDIELGTVPQDAGKGRGGGFGLSSKEQITPADAVLAEESANEVRLLFPCPRSYRKLTPYP
jgi:metal transporter CNNM